VSRPVNRLARWTDARRRLIDLVMPRMERARGAPVDYETGFRYVEIREAIEEVESAAAWWGNGEPAGSVRPIRRRRRPRP
jgi:hypothetical protein